MPSAVRRRLGPDRKGHPASLCPREHVRAGIRHRLVNEAHVPGQARVHSFPAESLRAVAVACRPKRPDYAPRRCRPKAHLASVGRRRRFAQTAFSTRNFPKKPPYPLHMGGGRCPVPPPAPSGGASRPSDRSSLRSTEWPSIASHARARTPAPSSTIRTACSRTSGEYRLGLPMDSILPINGASRKPRTVQTPTMPEPQVIVVVDDVLTKDSHYRAVLTVLSERFPRVPLIGLFIARRAPDGFDFWGFSSF